VMAVACDAQLPECRVEVLDLNAPEAVAGFVMARLGLDEGR